MNLLIVDNEGSGVDLGLRAMAYGHSVKLFISGPDTEIGEGLVPTVTSWEREVPWADVVFMTDNTRFMRELGAMREQGFPIFGPSREAAAWELDRAKGQEILDKAGIDTIPYKAFTDYDKAIAYVVKNGGRYVSKPSNEADKSLSYVAESPDDMVFQLMKWKQERKLKGEFILQAFVPGVEMAIGSWFGPAGFQHWLENWEFKKFMNDDLGPNTGEQGTVLRYAKKSKLADKVLKPLESHLAELAYTGYVDVNCIVDERGNPWPLEFTMRPGWPLFQIQQAVHLGDPIAWMLDLMDGTNSLKVSEDVATGVVVSIPDYPYSKLTRREMVGIPIYGITPKIRDHIHPAEMMKTQVPSVVDGAVKMKPGLASAGDYVMVVTGTGKTVKASSTQAYDVLEKISMPRSPQYRTDIGNRLKKQLPVLQKHGYATGLEYD